MHGSLLSAASGKSEALLPDVPFPDDGEWFWVTVFVPLAAQGAYQSHFRWALIKTLISQFFSLKLVIFEKNQWKII